MKFNWYYVLIFVLFAAMLFVSTRYFKGSRYSTVGVTSDREHKVTAEKSALVKDVRVVAGQQVKAGELLVELSSNELDIDIAKLKNQIEVLNAAQTEKTKLTLSKIAFVKADEGIRLEEINTGIAQAESELKLNMKLTKNFISSTDTTNAEPLKFKLQALKKQHASQQSAIEIKIKDIQQQSEAEQRLVADQILLLNRELSLYLDEQKALNKYASADGLVGNVFVRSGEQVEAFTPLLSINLVHPTTVIGYLVGKKTAPNVGTKVQIQSYERSSNISDGTVIGYGAVVSLPDILQKSTAVKAFGREIFIEITPANEFAIGEKVLIR